MFSLAGKKALVTGASGGIGAAIAKTLHDAGATVAISGTRVAVLEEVKAGIGDRVHILPCNLSSPEDVEKLIPSADAAMGGLDILVNNAGITKDTLALRMKDEDWQAVIDVNLTATFRLCRAAMKIMMKARTGRIINVTSIVGVTGNPGQANYVASKAGLIGLTKTLAYEMATRGVTANCIAPGFIATPMTEVLNEKQKEAILGRIPAGRMGGPADIASACLYLASDEAGYMTGQTLHINGGMAMI
ncbi:3-oxoacyl-[acyl-carrier-protein] reductase [Aestuariivirga litoralis]|uniref:3-oxoacyl-[acyl-carrier-protein] reductase n=1 Tax=Aestuariivirga litoralis TaxID=2650924 RepID=UPI0018C7E707|nr:3-oxoacyl-[acyl-carrier-protein] reductase [Aestuariivirga litoralis]MBG1232036.1 3-oxoacyl-[acyl-carrier-protein] reductase [Aestuariivirga litoralis]